MYVATVVATFQDSVTLFVKKVNFLAYLLCVKHTVAMKDFLHFHDFHNFFRFTNIDKFVGLMYLLQNFWRLKILEIILNQVYEIK